ncbi:MAG: DUF4190 domain-containing protein [Micromonosporaceae bacterium]|jgi:hypothetical protein
MGEDPMRGRPAGEGPESAGQPGPGGQQTDTLGLLSLILGIASIPLVFCFVLGLPAGIAAIILGAIALRRVRPETAANRWQPIVGIICGAVAVIAVVLVILLRH